MKLTFLNSETSDIIWEREQESTSLINIMLNSDYVELSHRTFKILYSRSTMKSVSIFVREEATDDKLSTDR